MTTEYFFTLFIENPCNLLTTEKKSVSTVPQNARLFCKSKTKTF